MEQFSYLIFFDLILSYQGILSPIKHLIAIWTCGHYYKVQGTHGEHMLNTCCCAPHGCLMVDCALLRTDCAPHVYHMLEPSRTIT
jgi:hypothetical protein